MELIYEFLPHIIAVLAVLVALSVSTIVILSKTDSRSAIAWVGLILLVPFLGSFLYLLFGVNRIQRRAQRTREPRRGRRAAPRSAAPSASRVRQDAAASSPEPVCHLPGMARFMEALGAPPLQAGNSVECLVDGDEAYPAMLAAVDAAERTLTIATYIFNCDRVGNEFIARLAAAHRRGVKVHVLVDDLGSSHLFRSAARALTRAGVPAARFMPLLSWQGLSINLRNHRKTLIADGRVGFTGGINFDERSCMAMQTRAPARDLHFKVTGPIVESLQAVFCEDWYACTAEEIQGDDYFPALQPTGTTHLRSIADGPDSTRALLRWTLHGALACARSRVLVLTPYFIPDRDMVVALGVAALRGVEVDIILPAKSDHAYSNWAAMAHLGALLERGVRVWYSPPPFDHSKLMVVDGVWSFFGSANWDPRSLRLNFELNVEACDAELGARLEKILLERRVAARPITLAEVDGRSLPVRFRDGLARLFSPIL